MAGARRAGADVSATASVRTASDATAGAEHSTTAAAAPTITDTTVAGGDVTGSAGTDGPVDADASVAADAATEAAGGADTGADDSSAPQPDSDIERGWTPVPVPVPSYTLKAPAPRRDIAPYEAPVQEPAAAEAAEQPVLASGLAGSPYAPVLEAELAEPQAPALPAARGLDLDSVLARRRAVGA